MNDTSALENALKKCSGYAKRGKKIANSSIALLQKASDNIMRKLDSTISNCEKRNIKADETITPLMEQLTQVREEVSLLPDKLKDSVQLLPDKTINITLFGRTMAGKSTLMEVLTHGNGGSIGKGGQRTTRDVREYIYKGMVVTDVPGIAAFGGEEDTQIAFEAAKTADLILFLITDDAPQASEAVCLRGVLSLGKPVLCLINIRANIDKKTPIRIFERDLDKKMRAERLEAIKTQFLEFGLTYGQDWGMLQFEFVHLKAAFLSQQPDWNENSDLLYRLSRFALVEDFIAQEVIKNGCFYKIKSYIDAVTIPILSTADMLMQQYANNSEQYYTISDKKENLNSWLDKFEIKGEKKIHDSLEELKSRIKKDISPFSETHYDDKKAGEKWTGNLKQYKIEEHCAEILNELAKECEEKLTEIYREITAELKYNDHVFGENNIEMPSIINGKSIWNWSVTLISGSLGIAAMFGVPVVGWVALGVAVVGGLLSLTFKSKEKKIEEARLKLQNKLSSELDNQFSSIEKKLKDLFVNDLIKKQVTPTFSLFDNILDLMKSMYETQMQLSNELYDKQEEFNQILLNEVLNYSNLKVFEISDIECVARIPGTCIALVVHHHISDSISLLISDILREKVYLIPYSVDEYELAVNTIGLNKREIQVICRSSKIERFVITKNKLSPITINRIKLAQQITKIFISK